MGQNRPKVFANETLYQLSYDPNRHQQNSRGFCRVRTAKSQRVSRGNQPSGQLAELSVSERLVGTATGNETPLPRLDRGIPAASPLARRAAAGTHSDASHGSGINAALAGRHQSVGMFVPRIAALAEHLRSEYGTHFRKDCYLGSIAYRDDQAVRTRRSIARRFKALWPGGVDQPIQGVHASEAQTWLGFPSNRVGKATRNESLRLVRQMFPQALNDRTARENPAASIKQRRLDKPIRETPTGGAIPTHREGHPRPEVQRRRGGFLRLRGVPRTGGTRQLQGGKSPGAPGRRFGLPEPVF